MDRDLIEKARAGDREAQDRIFAEAADRVRSYIHIRLGRRLRDDVDSLDVLQETYAAACQAFATFTPRGEGGLEPWLCAIAENQIRGLADRQGAQKRTPPGELAPISRVLEKARGTGPATAAARDEERAHLEEGLLRLDPQDREVLLLRHFQDLSIEEIAARLGRSATSVRRLLGLATARLGQVLTEGMRDGR